MKKKAVVSNDLEKNEAFGKNQELEAFPQISKPLLNENLIVEEDPSSLWQYCIHEKGHIRQSDLILTFILGVFYLISFYTVIAQLEDMPTVTFTQTKHISNYGAIWLTKIFFLTFLFVQAECECIDGWRMVKFAVGTKNTITVVGSMQYFFGCLVEIVSYSLINRSATIFNIMTNSAALTVFLRIDDVFVGYMHKIMPQRKKKVKYDKGAQDKDDKQFLNIATLCKIGLFCILEILFNITGNDILG